MSIVFFVPMISDKLQPLAVMVEPMDRDLTQVQEVETGRVWDTTSVQLYESKQTAMKEAKRLLKDWVPALRFIRLTPPQASRRTGTVAA